MVIEGRYKDYDYLITDENYGFWIIRRCAEVVYQKFIVGDIKSQEQLIKDLIDKRVESKIPLECDKYAFWRMSEDPRYYPTKYGYNGTFAFYKEYIIELFVESYSIYLHKNELPIIYEPYEVTADDNDYPHVVIEYGSFDIRNDGFSLAKQAIDSGRFDITEYYRLNDRGLKEFNSIIKKYEYFTIRIIEAMYRDIEADYNEKKRSSTVTIGDDQYVFDDSCFSKFLKRYVGTDITTYQSDNGSFGYHWIYYGDNIKKDGFETLREALDAGVYNYLKSRQQRD